MPVKFCMFPVIFKSVWMPHFKILTTPLAPRRETQICGEWLRNSQRKLQMQTNISRISWYMTVRKHRVKIPCTMDEKKERKKKERKNLNLPLNPWSLIKLIIVCLDEILIFGYSRNTCRKFFALCTCLRVKLPALRLDLFLRNHS